MAKATIHCPHGKAALTRPVGQVGRCPSCGGEVRVHAVGEGVPDEALPETDIVSSTLKRQQLQRLSGRLTYLFLRPGDGHALPALPERKQIVIVR
jgi:hypothetical protein